MPYYGFVGEGRVEICAGHLAPEGSILMSGPRPSTLHVASADGTWVEDPAAYRVKRKSAYPPVGDQLDALLKHLNKMRIDGADLVEELDSIIGQWLAVKKDYPKPE